MYSTPFFFFFSWMYPPVFLPLGQDFVGNLNKFTSCRTRFRGLHKHGPYKGKLGEELGQMSVPLNPHTRQQCWENLLPKAGVWIEKQGASQHIRSSNAAFDFPEFANARGYQTHITPVAQTEAKWWSDREFWSQKSVRGPPSLLWLLEMQILTCHILDAGLSRTGLPSFSPPSLSSEAHGTAHPSAGARGDRGMAISQKEAGSRQGHLPVPLLWSPGLYFSRLCPLRASLGEKGILAMARHFSPHFWPEFRLVQIILSVMAVRIDEFSRTDLSPPILIEATYNFCTVIKIHSLNFFPALLRYN